MDNWTVRMHIVFLKKNFCCFLLLFFCWVKENLVYIYLQSLCLHNDVTEGGKPLLRADLDYSKDAE